MTIRELSELLTVEAVRGQRALAKAKRMHDERQIGYWTAYVESRERILVILGEILDEG